MSAGLLLFLNASVYRDVSILIHPSIRRSVVSVSTRERNNNNERTNERKSERGTVSTLVASSPSEQRWNANASILQSGKGGTRTHQSFNRVKVERKRFVRASVVTMGPAGDELCMLLTQRRNCPKEKFCFPNLHQLVTECHAVCHIDFSFFVF